MEQLHVLGTGHAGVTRCYNTCFVLDDGDTPLLVDAGGGNGILPRLDAMGLPLTRLRHAFLSHCHTDHLFGMIWIVRMVGSLIRAGKHEGFTLYCHAELAETVVAIARMTLSEGITTLFGDRLRIVPVADGETRPIGRRECTFFDIGARKTRQFGCAIRLSDRQRLVFLGDEPFRAGSRLHAEHADWLLSEAFCLASEEARFYPHEKGHGTVREACAVAEELGVNNLVLWHTEDSDLAHRKERYGAEGREVFGGRLFIPDDMETLPLTFVRQSRSTA